VEDERGGERSERREVEDEREVRGVRWRMRGR
jgi:hypothetical protein